MDHFFNPEKISGGEDSGFEDSLQKVLGLVRRHLLAVEPQPLQLLKEQLIRMRRFDELEEISVSSGTGRERSTEGTEKDGWAHEVRRRAFGVSGKESGHRTPESIRMACAERSLIKQRVRDSSYANPSSFARNHGLGWDRGVLASARAAAVTTWLARRIGQTFGKPSWEELSDSMEKAFDLGRLHGASTVRESLLVVEEHLLQTGTERVAEETGLPCP
jgi:hypothetical protein